MALDTITNDVDSCSTQDGNPSASASPRRKRRGVRNSQNCLEIFVRANARLGQFDLQSDAGRSAYLAYLVDALSAPLADEEIQCDNEGALDALMTIAILAKRPL